MRENVEAFALYFAPAKVITADAMFSQLMLTTPDFTSSKEKRLTEWQTVQWLCQFLKDVEGIIISVGYVSQRFE
jgi:hypothetical protein